MIRIAQIINTRGLKGECKVKLFTDQDDIRFQKGNHLYLKDHKKLTVKNYSVYKGFGYVQFDEITSIEQAEALKGQELFLPKEELNELEEDEFYYHELQDCHVFNQQEKTLELSPLFLKREPTWFYALRMVTRNICFHL